LIPAVLFPLIPLMALARVAPGHWTAIFGKVGGRELRLMIGFALLNHRRHHERRRHRERLR
jgi:hypothetical protein